MALSTVFHTDITCEEGYHAYAITLTCSPCFSGENCDDIVSFHKEDYFHNVLLINELHDSGETHFHALADIKCKQAAGVTRKYERFYKAHDIAYVKGISAKIKTCTDKVGWMHYLLKEFTDDDVPLVLKGWKWTWVQQLVRDSIKKMPHRMLLKDVYKVTKSNGTEIICKYMQVNSMRVANKEDFMDVICAMSREKYRFSSASIKWCFVEVLIQEGHSKGMRALLEHELFHLDC